MGDLSSLSGKPRHENLKKLKPLGVWERQQLALEKGTVKKVAITSPVVAVVEMPGQKFRQRTGQIDGQIDIKTEQEKENDMSTARKKGKCELCQKKGLITIIEGKQCCATCEHLRRNAKLRGGLMLEQLREFHPELLADPADGEVLGEDRQALNAELAAANSRMVVKLRELELKNSKLREENLQIKGELEGLQDEINDSLQIKADLFYSQFNLLKSLKEIILIDDGAGCPIGDDSVFLLDDAKRLMSELATLRDENTRLNFLWGNVDHAGFVHGETLTAERVSSWSDRESVLLDLALDIISGKVSGLGADRLAQLRVA